MDVNDLDKVLIYLDNVDSRVPSEFYDIFNEENKLCYSEKQADFLKELVIPSVLFYFF